MFHDPLFWLIWFSLWSGLGFVIGIITMTRR